MFNLLKKLFNSPDNNHIHNFKEYLLYTIDKDIEHSDISDEGFTRTYRVKAVKNLECSCGVAKQIVTVDKTFYQHNPLDKDKFIGLVVELEHKGYRKSEMV